MASPWTRLVRFETAESDVPRIGQPVNGDLDVGLAMRQCQKVDMELFSGQSVLSPGQPTGVNVTASRLLCPLLPSEIGTIRGIALNYHSHAKHTGLTIPDVPMMFMKPSTAMVGPFPDHAIIPKAGAAHNAADYESELAVVIGRTCKNVTKEEAMDYVYGYMAANDISSRTLQWSEKQWCRSKGFDGSCPLGPCIVAKAAMPDWADCEIQGTLNGETVQSSRLDDLIFDLPTLISILSESTTLPPGTVILTGTPAGVGFSSTPPRFLAAGDEFAVTIKPHIGTLTNVFKDEV